MSRHEFTPCPKPQPRIKKRRGYTSVPTKRKEERRSGRDRDPAYLAKVRAMRVCYAKVKFPRQHTCDGRIEADHMGQRPLGRKCHDREAGPMCTVAHWQRTNYVGVFEQFTAVEMRAFCDEAIAWTQNRLGYTPPKETAVPPAVDIEALRARVNAEANERCGDCGKLLLVCQCAPAVPPGGPAPASSLKKENP